MSFMHNPADHPNEKEKPDVNLVNQKIERRVIFVDSRSEMNAVSRTLQPGDVVVLRGTDPEIVDYLVNFEWTDEDEACLMADFEEN